MRKCRKPFHATSQKTGNVGIPLSCLAVDKFGMQSSCLWKLRGGKWSCTSWEVQWENLLRNICMVKVVLWASLNFTVGLKHAHTAVSLLWETLGLSSPTIWVFCTWLVTAWPQPQRDETPARHPKPGCCSAALHSTEPSGNLTPQQHKGLNFTAAILIIWHFLWIFTSPWVR